MRISGLALLVTTSWTFQKASGEVLHLTEANFNEKTAGKTVFLKFYAPWCGHCKAMAPDWDKLAKEWQGHAVGLVAKVDCTSEDAAALCERFEIEGFPTVLWGDSFSPETYEGERDYESMAAFAKENISTPVCSVKNVDYCDDEQKNIIKDLQAKSKEELEAIEADVQKKVEAAQSNYDAALQKLSDEYETMTDEFNAELDKVRKESNYKWVEQILSLSEVDEAASEL